MADYPYRVTLAMPALAVVPDGDAAAVAHWLNAQLGQNTVPDDLGPPLSPTGDDPPTHHWCSSGWTEADCRSMLGRLADLAGIERPPASVWNGWTMFHRLAWANGTLAPALAANANGGLLMDDATGEWSTAALLETMALRPVVPAEFRG